MTDNLRDRIAAAIYNASDEYTRKLMVRPDCPGASELEGDSKPVCYTLADAVIAELGLSREWGRLDPTDSGVIYDSLEDALAAIDLPNEKLRTRLITDWVDVQQG